MLLTSLIQKFPCMYNCHYQFEVCITAICVDSQSNRESGVFLRVCMYPPFSFKEHDLVLCHFCLAALKGMKPSLHNGCRYLSVGRSIPCQSGRPVALHPDTWAACPFHSPHFIWLALPAMTQFSEW